MSLEVLGWILAYAFAYSAAGLVLVYAAGRAVPTLVRRLLG